MVFETLPKAWTSFFGGPLYAFLAEKAQFATQS